MQQLSDDYAQLKTKHLSRLNLSKYDKLQSFNAAMKKQYTKKQITEAIAYWKKKLNEDTNEKNVVTVVPIISILEKADKFDFCGSWPGNGSFVWGIKFSQDSIHQLNSAFAKYQGSSYNKFVCLNKVLSRSQFDEQAEYYNNIPYEHYIKDAKFDIQEAFDDYPILKELKPCDMIIVDDVVANDKPGCSFIAALYVFQ